jgi:PAS domain S-box-containing protein
MIEELNILLVEDNPGDARLIREALISARGAQFHLQVVDRLSTGIERLAAGGIDLVLLDLSLPDSQGLETFTTVHARAPGVPIIVLTGLDNDTVATTAVREGAQDYLVKGQATGDLLARSIRYAIERQRAEEALRESEARFSTVFRANPAAIAITRLSDGRLADVNQAWQDLTGYTYAEAVGHTPYELNLWVKPEQRERLIDVLREQRTARGEMQLRRRSGELCDALMSAELIELAGECYLLTLAQDITERKQAEQQLAAQLDELRRWYTATLGREGRVLELKHEVNELLRRLGEPVRYPSAEA